MSALVAPGFESVLEGFADETLQSETSTVVGLWPDLTYAYFNEGWLRFARENDGPDEAASSAYLGRHFLDVVPRNLQARYREFFDGFRSHAETERHPPRLEYECHSPMRFRRMSMTAYPSPSSDGILVVHSVVREAPLESEVAVHHVTNRHEYIHENGFIHQCAHCRRVQHPAEDRRWDMVPELISLADLRISHTLCLFCRDVYWKV